MAPKGVKAPRTSRPDEHGEAAASKGTAQLVVCIRADADRSSGLGHLSRSKALGDVLLGHSRAGFAEIRVLYACRYRREAADPEQCAAMVEKVLGRALQQQDLALPLERDTGAEALALAAWALEQQAAWLVLDHYGLTDQYLQGLRTALKGAVRLLVMDDHQRRGVGTVDLRLAPTQSPAAPEPQALTGLQYLLLRKEFSGVNKAAPSERSSWVVCFGGADPGGLTRRALDLLKGHMDAGLEAAAIVVVASDSMASEQALDEVLAKMPGARRENWLSPLQMAQLFATAKAALVSASGVACEACAMACPVVAMAWVDNQKNHARALSELGVPVFDKVECAVAKLLAGGAALAGAAVDTFGAWRVAGEMLRLTPQALASAETKHGRITLRHAAMTDCLPLLEWRNDVSVRALCRNTGVIQLGSHTAWLASTMVSTTRTLWIAELEGEAAGYVRVDEDKARGGFELSWLTQPACQRKGVSRHALSLLLEHFPAGSKFLAEVYRSNIASIKLAEALGFQRAEEHPDGLLVYVLQQ